MHKATVVRQIKSNQKWNYFKKVLSSLISFNRVKSSSLKPVMKIFTQKFNPLSGKSEWIMQEENYDYHQEVARSSYADMLHDKERNEKYFDALKKAIAKMKSEGKPIKVLDIGTGSGLLSMMAVQAGADSVTACEAFEPVAKCALQVIRDNGYENKIKVIPKRSTEVTVGPDGDMLERANLLVTEVFDTELIGEGALGTFRHALTHLLESNPIVIPSSATVYAQIIDSPVVSSFNKLKPVIVSEESEIAIPSKVSSCTGAAAVHDVQMAQITEDQFVPLIEPVAVFEFDFCGTTPLKLNEISTKEVSILNEGQSDAVFMWWDLKMDMDGDIILSCAPPWSHPEPQQMPWRDHWMQAIYYLPENHKVSAGDMLQFSSYHDEYSLWFRTYSSPDAVDKAYPSPVCSCMMHCVNSRSRIGMINDDLRNQKYVEMLKKYITPTSTCLFVSDGSLLPLLAAKLGAKKVYAVEPTFLHCDILTSFIKHNNLESKIHVINKSFDSITKDDINHETIDLVMADPFFSTSLLPWHSLYFWYLRDLLSPLLSKSAITLPQRIRLRGIAVEFDDLWKIRAPVVEAEGFDLSAFDEMVQKAIDDCDEKVEPHPLWEYRSKALTDSFDLMEFDMSSDISNKPYKKSGFIEVASSGKCNAVALWVDFETDNIVITTGPTLPVIPGKQISWDIHSRQGVYFIHPFEPVSAIKQRLNYEMTFDANSGEFDFNFVVDCST